MKRQLSCTAHAKDAVQEGTVTCFAGEREKRPIHKVNIWNVRALTDSVRLLISRSPLAGPCPHVAGHPPSCLYPILPNPILPIEYYPTLSCPILPLPYPTPPRPTLPCLALPFPSVPCLSLPYPALP